MFTIAFWKATAERVAVVFVLTLASTLGIGAEALDIRAIRWGEALTIAGVAALGSLVKCLIASQVGVKGSPGLVADPAVVEPPPAEPAPEPEPTNVHRRRVQRADLDERLHERPSPSGAPIRESGSGYTGLSLSSRAEDVPLHEPGVHRRDPDLP